MLAMRRRDRALANDLDREGDSTGAAISSSSATRTSSAR
jgi:hypothetical protein